MVGIVDAITAGTAQYPNGYLQRGGHVRDSEGYLSFSEDGVAFYADSGAVAGWYYEQIASHTIKRGLVMRKLTLRGEGFEETFKIGDQLAANGDYILTAAQRMGGRLPRQSLPTSHETAPPPSAENYAKAQAAAPDSVICRFCLAPNPPPPARINCEMCGHYLDPEEAR
jgi:hypothetical protein